MKTDELIDYLISLRDYKDELAWELRGKIDRKIVLNEIIKKLKELEELKKIRKRSQREVILETDLKHEDSTQSIVCDACGGSGYIT